MRRRTAYARHRNNINVRNIVLHYQHTDVLRLFTAPMMSDDEGEEGVVRVPHYRTVPVCISLLLFLSYCRDIDCLL